MTPASKPAAATSSAGGASRAPPPPPSRNVAPPPPPPPEEPDVEQYKAKFAFEGQPGEMTLKKDDIVELVEKTDNGWWLVKMNGSEGWAPNNYLELVPPKPKARPAAAPPPPPPPRPRHKYVWCESIGSGSFGVVYVSSSLSNNNQSHIKFLTYRRK